VIKLCKFFVLLLFITPACLEAQVKFSLATDLSILRNFDGKQKFTVFGQTIIPQFHIDKKSSLYGWFTYHSNGKYKSSLTAKAKSVLTSPQTLAFTNQSEMRLRHFSVGYKKYFKGSFDNEKNFNLYGTFGFGLIMGTASNTFSQTIDTALYLIQDNVVNGSGDFKRLSFDIAGGIDYAISYDIFLYSEIRWHIPTTDYPNNYLLKSSKAPLLGGINLGLRILFNADP
jgi:opacity protein-like surface antigen